MKKAKGCINEKCNAHKKKEFYNEDDVYCSKCAGKLVYVCRMKKCYKELGESDGKYCVSCQADLDDRKDNTKKVTKDVAGMAGKVVGVVGAVGAASGVVVKIVNTVVKK